MMYNSFEYPPVLKGRGNPFTVLKSYRCPRCQSVFESWTTYKKEEAFCSALCGLRIGRPIIKKNDNIKVVL